MRALALTLCLAGCGHGVGDDDFIEPPLYPDGDYGLAPPTEYVINALTLPTGATAHDLSFDLDGVENPYDNALAELLAATAVDLQTPITRSFQGGATVMLGALWARAYAGDARWELFLGEPSAVPPLFDGTDTFAIDPSGSSQAWLDGTITGRTFDGGPGNAPLSIVLADDQAPLLIPLVGSRIRAEVSASGATGGILGGALSEADVRDQLIPAIATLMAVTPEDLLADPAVQQAIELDLDMYNGTSFGPGQDGEPDSLSFVVGFTAVAASFDRPGE